jgi:hypothetical protein
MLKPPKDVPSEVLFRTLLGLPRPSVDISYRLPAAPDVALRVQALTAPEADAGPPEFVSAALLVGRQRAFRSAAEASRSLSRPELDALTDAVVHALARCSPIDGWADWREWDPVLLDGARHVANQRVAYALGSQFDVAGTLTLPRPERYFGVPGNELVDAHWFAYRAANALVLDVTKKR